MCMPSSYYAFYVAALGAAVQLAVVLSLLVSADRVLNVLKYIVIKARAKVTGRQPKDSWACEALPKEVEAYPLVSGGTHACMHARANSPPARIWLNERWQPGRRTRARVEAAPACKPVGLTAVLLLPVARALPPRRSRCSCPCLMSARCARPSSTAAPSWSGPPPGSRSRCTPACSADHMHASRPLSCHHASAHAHRHTHLAAASLPPPRTHPPAGAGRLH